MEDSSSNASANFNKEANSGHDQVIKSEEEIHTLLGDNSNNNNDTKKRSASEASDCNANDASKKPKKRRALSCLSCRKLKTRCDFEIENGKCHRCSKLRLECSLTKEYNIDPNQLRSTRLSSIAEQGQGINAINGRLNAVENNIDNLSSKMDSIINLLSGTSKAGRSSSFGSYDETLSQDDKQANPFTRKLSMNYTSVDTPRRLANNLSNGSDNYLDKYINDAPLNIIKLIDSTLFKRINKYDPLEKACEEFLEFYFNNEALCLQLAKSFLETSHFWIIPGGLKELNRQYVTEHPLITCVFVILAMCFDENYNYIEEQQQLYWLTTKLLGIALITDPLTDHDIEAILYLSLYNIARKPKQPQTDSWILSGTGLKHFITSMDFTAIKNRVLYLRDFDHVDLFHLRIWNSLCACHFQAALLSGRPVMIAREYFDIHKLTLKFPKATIGDAIKVSELNLDVTFLDILENSKDYLSNIILSNDIKPNSLLKFKELDEWKSKWEHLIKKDISGILLFAYDTYHIIICRRFISTIHEGQTESSTEAVLSCAYKTACHHSFVILERLLKLPSSLIRGSPSTALLQIVYASLTLCDYLQIMNLEDKSMALSLISKIYWHLNHIGEKMNDATDTVGKIIKSIVETASSTASAEPDKVDLESPGASKNPNDTVYDPGKAATAERKRSFHLSPKNPTLALNGKMDSPVDSVASGSSISKLNNFYSGNLKSLRLNQTSPENSINSPDTFLKKEMHKDVGTNNITSTTKTSPFDFDSVQIPDVSQFNTFEDFFNGVFSDFNGDFSNINGSRLETPKLTGIGGSNGISRLGKINNGKDMI